MQSSSRSKVAAEAAAAEGGGVLLVVAIIRMLTHLPFIHVSLLTFVRHVFS